MKNKEEYLKSKVNPVIQKLMVGLVKDTPEDVIQYCLKWFQKETGGKNQVISKTTDTKGVKNEPQPVKVAIFNEGI